VPYTLRMLMSEATTMSGTSPEVHASQVSFYVNEAQRDVAVRLPHAEFEALAVSSTTSAEDKLYLPGDCEAILSLSYLTEVTGVGGRVIRQASVWEVDAMSAGTSLGVPTMYLSYATWLQFYPSPDSSYSLQLRYQRRVSDITSLDAIPSVDTKYHRAVLLRTVEALHLRKGEYQQAALVGSYYEKEIGDRPNMFQQRQQNRSGMAMRYQKDED